MVGPQELAENNERYVIGQWFNSLADAVKAYPMRAGTLAGKVIEYDRATVSPVSRSFNLASKSRHIVSGLDQAAVCRHVYKLDRTTKWDEADEQGLSVAAKDFDNGIGTVDAKTFATGYMLENMKKLYKICKLNRIGVSVHTPEPGRIQIDLVPQERPICKPVLRAPKMTFGK
ncbi:MAG: hypothetical protein EPN97_00415 [Alphaproteobacteria bacterium]|nr:MAG: hypothetical protein EPN97_00415 [Alphaproteobacteria bacterium]